MQHLDLGWLIFLGLTLVPGLVLWVWGTYPHPLRLRTLCLYLAAGIGGNALAFYLLREAGLSPESAQRLLLSAYLASGLLTLYLLQRMRLEWEADDTWVIVGAATLMLLVWLPLHGDYRLIMGTHGMWHTASAWQALLHVPPESPVHAGLPAYLYWAYDLFLGQLGLACHRTPAEVGIAINLLACLPVVAGALTFAEVFFSATPWRWLATLLCVGGMNALGIGWLLLRILTKQGPLAEYLLGPRLDVQALYYKWNNNALALGGFYEVGGAAAGDALLLVTLAIVLPALQRGLQRADGLVLACCVGGGLLLHPTSGAMAGGVLLVAWVLALIMRRQGPPGALRTLSILALWGLGGLIVGGYHAHELQGDFQATSLSLVGLAPHLLLHRLWDLCGPWLWALVLVPVGLLIGIRQRTPQAWTVVLCALGLVLAALQVALPYDNHYKFVALLAPFVAVSATWALSALKSPRLQNIAAGTLATCVLLSLIVGGLTRANSRNYEAAFQYRASGGDVRWSKTADPHANQMYLVIRLLTPENAVIIEDPRGIGQNTQLLEVPVIARRQGFTGVCDYWMSGGYRDCPQRMAIVTKLSRGEALGEDDWARLRALKRPLYLLLKVINPEVQPAAWQWERRDPAHFQQEFAVPGMKLYRITLP
jgi:hypothetical protein